MICENEQHLLKSLTNLVAAVPRTSDHRNTTAHDNSTGSHARLTKHNTATDDNDEIRTSSIPLTDGRILPTEYSAHHFKTVYKDEYTGEELPTHLVRAAMEEELEYFNARVWDAVEKKLT